MTRQHTNVLFVHHGGDWIRGSEACLLSIIGHQLEAGKHCSLAANSTILLERASALGAETFQLAEGETAEFFPPKRIVTYSREVIERFRPSVIHINSPEIAKGYIAAGAMSGIPTVFHVHSIQRAAEHRWNWTLLASRIVGCGNAATASYEKHGIDGNRVTTIRNGVPFTDFGGKSNERAAELLGTRVGIPTVIFVGSLIARKRPSDLLEALTLVENVDAVIVGSGEQDGELRALVSQRGLADRVRFLGDRRDVPMLLSQADIFVAPSGWEALPLGVIEAAGVGLPIVASDIEPHREILGEYFPSILYPTGSVRGMADALNAAVVGALGARWSSDSAHAIREQFSQSQFLHGFSLLYETMSAESRASILSALPNISQVRALLRRSD